MVVIIPALKLLKEVFSLLVISNFVLLLIEDGPWAVTKTLFCSYNGPRPLLVHFSCTATKGINGSCRTMQHAQNVSLEDGTDNRDWVTRANGESDYGYNSKTRTITRVENSNIPCMCVQRF